MKGYFYMAISAFSFCLMTVFVKLAGQEIQTIQIVFLRGLITLGITYYLINKYNASIWGGSRGVLFMRGVTGSVALFFVYESLQRFTVSEATVIQYLYPIFTAIFGSFLLSEKLSLKLLITIIIGFFGIFTIFDFPFLISNNIEFSWDLSIALIGSCLTGAAYVLVRKASKLNESPYTIMFYFPLFTVLLSSPFIISYWIPPSIKCWFYIIMVGIFTQLGQIFLTFGYKILPAGKAASASYIQVPFSAVVGIALFGDSISTNFIFGSIIVFIAILIIITDKQSTQSNY